MVLTKWQQQEQFGGYWRMEGRGFLFVPNKEPNSNGLQLPENPGIREMSVSTYGNVIPVSIGRRAVTGNIIDAEPLAPVLEGAKVTVSVFNIPIYNWDSEGSGGEGGGETS